MKSGYQQPEQDTAPVTYSKEHTATRLQNKTYHSWFWAQPTSLLLVSFWLLSISNHQNLQWHNWRDFHLFPTQYLETHPLAYIENESARETMFFEAILTIVRKRCHYGFCASQHLHSIRHNWSHFHLFFRLFSTNDSYKHTHRATYNSNPQEKSISY